MTSSENLLHFNFHNVVAAQINTKSSQVTKFYKAEYENHLVNELPDDIPTVNLNFEYSPVWRACPAGYTRHIHKGLAHWIYRIDISKEAINIDIVGNQWSIPMVHHMLLHQALRYLASKQGILMLHAGAVARSNRSLIFTGHGGAGKTITTSLVLACGGTKWSVHADDYVFLAPDSRSLAYVTRSHLYRDLLRWVPNLKSQLSPAERLRLEVLGYLRTWSGDRIKWPVRLPVDRLWPGYDITIQAKSAGLLILEHTDQSEPQLRFLPADKVPVEPLIEMNFREARHFLNLVAKNHAMPDIAGWVERWRATERDTLTQWVKEIPSFMLLRPCLKEASPGYQKSLESQLTELITHSEGLNEN